MARISSWSLILPQVSKITRTTFSPLYTCSLFHWYMLDKSICHFRGVGSILSFLLCPATKSGGVLCYTLQTFECLSVRPSVCPSVRPSVYLSVRPSAVDHSCPLHNFDTVQDNFTKLGTNVKHDQTTCRD